MADESLEQAEQQPVEEVTSAAATETTPEPVAATPSPEPKQEAAPAETAEPAAGTSKEPRRRSRDGRYVPAGIVHITSTFNNTLVSITDTKGAVVSWSSGGRCGFKGSRKSTAFAATTVAQEAARVAVAAGMREVSVKMQGPGAGRESAVRALQGAGLTVTAIQDVTPIPHNGCRPPKRRRV